MKGQPMKKRKKDKTDYERYADKKNQKPLYEFWHRTVLHKNFCSCFAESFKRVNFRRALRRIVSSSFETARYDRKIRLRRSPATAYP